MAPKRSAENLGTWKVLLQLARPYRKRFILIALLALLGIGADLLQPLIYRTAINDVAGLFVDRVEEKAGPPVAPTEAQPSIRDQQLERLEKTQLPHRPDYVAPRTRRQALTTLLWAVALLFVISVVGYFLSLAADLQSTAVACAIESNLIQATFGHVLRLPLAFFNRRASGGLARRIDQSDQVAPIVSAVARQIAPEVLSIAGICAIMLTQSWRLTVAALAILPVYLIITRHAARRLESGMAEYYVMWENVSVRINDALAAIKTVKLSGAETREGDRLQAASQEAYGDYLDRARLGNRYLFLQSALSHFSKALVLGYGGWMVLDRRLTPGDVVMFVAYLDRIYDPIDSLSSIAVNLQQHMASLHRAVRLLHTHPMEPSGAELLPGPGRIEFREVAFGYGPQREVLRGVTFTAEAGKVTAITGPSGAGKTTAADLLLKLWEPDSGEIRIDGQCLSQVDPSSVRRAIGMVAADGAVFRGTLAENVRYKRPGATDRASARRRHRRGLGGSPRPPAPRAGHGNRRAWRGPVGGRTPAPSDRAHPGGSAAHPGLGRSHRQSRLCHRTGSQKVARRPLLPAHHAGDRPPLLHGQGRGPRDCDGSGPNRGARNSRSTHRGARLVRPSCHLQSAPDVPVA